ncbi:MAG TPA: prohibitin family protein [Candidatus Gracilibacteria bacterium]
MKNLTSTLRLVKYLVVIIAVMILFFGINPFVTISAGHKGVVFDKLNDGIQQITLGEGLHFKLPFFQEVIQIPVRSQKVVFVDKTNDQLAYNKISFQSYVPTTEYGSMLAASSDLQDVYVDAVVTYHVDPAKVATVYQEIGSDYESKKVIPKTIDSVKTFTAKYKVADILTKREEIKKLVQEYLTAELGRDNIILEDVNLTNFDFNPQFKAAIEQKQIEEQKAQKEEYVLRQIEISSQQKVKQAEANKQAKILEGEGIAEFNQLLQQDITDEILEFKRLENARSAIEKWNGAYPATYFGSGDGNSPIPLINLNK